MPEALATESEVGTQQDLLFGEIAVAKELPRLFADERKMKQILLNLLTNAIKFTKPGGRIRLRADWAAGGALVFEVADTGIGIAPEDIPKALDKFGQIDSQLSRTQDGTGLGLPLTMALVEAHGGRLDLTSEVDVGTTVTLRFPPERAVNARESQQALAG